MDSPSATEALAPGEVAIASISDNQRGRLKATDAEIYLASPAVVAASAVAGFICEPRDLGRVIR